ncbi:NAD(P)-dependent oxidoreductase [Streptomyces albus]|uniref:NAD(P)-dependent oxidoreductase n=1 Tax=Streptomyces albidoflavus TaxID=1886 RepID=UPI0024CBCCE3|nr:NAD(P)-dependent oxidoreductase [Streptomyces albus]
MERIAFLGLGSMGTPMARRLLAAGHPLTVWNRTASRAEPLRAEGAQVALSPAEAVLGTGIVVTMLAGPEALDAVAEEVLPALGRGTVWAEMSTVGPDAVAALRERLPGGVTLVDAPVMGSVDAAASGSLQVLAGGEVDGPVAEVLERFGSVRRCGPPGSGAALKVVLINAMIGGVAVVAESLRLADALGVDPAGAREALAAGPMGGAVRRTLSDSAHYTLDLAAKDVGLAVGAADLPVLRAVGEELRSRDDLAGQDLSALREPRA